jgi:H+/Cl- antiporter ClcA
MKRLVLGIVYGLAAVIWAFLAWTRYHRDPTGFWPFNMVAAGIYIILAVLYFRTWFGRPRGE